LAATLHVLPIFQVCAFLVVEEENIVMPGVQVGGAVRRAELGSVPGIVELGVVTDAAVRAGDA
jgi:hypothetical protein